VKKKKRYVGEEKEYMTIRVGEKRKKHDKHKERN
jgi:hypothetical protein